MYYIKSVFSFILVSQYIVFFLLEYIIHKEKINQLNIYILNFLFR